MELPDDQIDRRFAEIRATVASEPVHVDEGKRREKRWNAEALSALGAVLGGEDDTWVTTQAIADEVNHHDLYRNDDGSPIGPGQVCEWVDEYPFFFEREEDRVRRKPPDPGWMLSRWSPVLNDERVRDWLSNQGSETAIVTFDELEELGVELPWTRDGVSTSPSVYTSGLGEEFQVQVVAGWHVERIDKYIGGILFRRIDDNGTAGVREPRRPSPTEPSDEIRRSPTDEGDQPN